MFLTALWKRFQEKAKLIKIWHLVFGSCQFCGRIAQVRSYIYIYIQAVYIYTLSVDLKRVRLLCTDIKSCRLQRFLVVCDRIELLTRLFNHPLYKFTSITFNHIKLQNYESRTHDMLYSNDLNRGSVAGIYIARAPHQIREFDSQRRP